MNSSLKRMAVIATVFAVSIGGALGYQAFGAAMLAGQPSVVVSVNLGVVMEKLDQWADASARLRKLKDELTSEQQRRTAEIESMQKEVKALQESVEKAEEAKKSSLETQLQELQEKAAKASLGFQAWMNFSAEKADIESALATQELYRSIKAAAAQIAAANRYDVVLVDDSQGELLVSGDSRMTRVQQVQQQIANRRTLYINPSIDITDDLIQRMNNARKVAGPAPRPQ